MPNKYKTTDLKRIVPALKYSWSGLKAAYKYEVAFRQEVLLAIICIPLAAFIAADFVEFALLTLAVVGIMVVELINSAIESVVDRVSLDKHELSGRAKDLGSAAVFISILFFILVWGYKLYQFFFNSAW